MKNSRRLFLTAALLGSCALTTSALAEAWPSQPVRLVVPFVPGGGADAVARIVATQMRERLGQPVLVENRPGAGGALAAEAVMRSPADGYTLLLATNTFVTTPLISKTSYDPLKNFTPVTTIGTSPYVLLVNANSDFKTLADLVKTAKAQPDKLNYGSAGQGGITHLLGELLKQRGGLGAQHVPYKGTAAALVDLLGGQIDFAFADTASAISHVRSGMLRALAITAPERSPALPDVPTSTEAGIPVEVVGFYAMVAPAEMAPALLAKLNDEMRQVIGSDVVKTQFATALTDPLAMPADQFAQRLAAEAALWKDVVAKSGSKFN